MVDTGSGRLFIVFTLAEASAILRPKPSPARTSALAKIQYALTHVTVAATEAEPSAPNPTQRRSVAVDPQAQRHARPTTRAPESSSSSDDCVPWRDEAGGIYR